MIPEIKKNKYPLVVIFGRTNVGKSTLFNCLTEKRQAIISNIEGTTRDSNIGVLDWQSESLQLVDTGGIMDFKLLFKNIKKINSIDDRVQVQARNYLAQADLILFLVDAQNGLMPQDKQMALYLKKDDELSSKVLLVANKADNPRLRNEVFEFNKLNLGEPIPVSAASGSGTGDLLDIVINKLKTKKLKLKTNKIKIPKDAKKLENGNFVFLHGVLRSSSVKDPLAWLNKKLPNKNNFYKKLPHPKNPDLDEQMKYVLGHAEINQDTTIITHSLGGILALKLIEKNNLKIKRLILIASPLQTKKLADGGVRKEFEDYGDGKYDFKKIKNLIGEVIVFVDENDHLVDSEEPKKIAEVLGGELIEMEAPISHFNCEQSEELLEAIEKRINKAESIRVCVLGQPNVGKSSLLNKLLGYERVIVSDVPHTTREPQDTEIDYQGNTITLIDTAGISKKGTKTKGLQKYGIEKSLAALKRSDVAILVLDISREITHQDLKIVEEISDRKKSFIIIANKWDLIEEKDVKKYKEYIYAKMPFCKWAEIHFSSALTGAKVGKIFDLIVELYGQRKIKISDTVLKGFMSKLIKRHKPSRGKGIKNPRIFSFKQIDIDPPYFEIRIGAGEVLHFSYLNFIENRLREKFGFRGTPIAMYVRKGKKVHGKAG